MAVDEASADVVAVLKDVEVGDESVVTHVTFRGRVVALSDLTQIFFEVSDGVLEAGHLGGMLGGPGLDSECKAVDKLTELWGGYVRVRVEGSEHGTGGQRSDVGEGGPSW